MADGDEFRDMRVLLHDVDLNPGGTSWKPPVPAPTGGSGTVRIGEG